MDMDTYYGDADKVLCWQAERDNKSVYFQHIPAADSLAAIQPRRLVTATAYTLPAPAALVNDTLMESFAEIPPDKVKAVQRLRASVMLPVKQTSCTACSDQNCARSRFPMIYQFLAGCNTCSQCLGGLSHPCLCGGAGTCGKPADCASAGEHNDWRPSGFRSSGSREEG